MVLWTLKFEVYNFAVLRIGVDLLINCVGMYVHN